MKSLLPFLLLIFCSCYNQNDMVLTFVNRSPHKIDSIVIYANTPVTLGTLEAGQKYSKAFMNVRLGGNEGHFSFAAFLNGKVYKRTWGFHDYGMFGTGKETFLIYDNGINWEDVPLPKPDLHVFFSNWSSKTIDTFLSTNHAILKINENTPRNFKIIFDYDKIEALKEFTVVLSGEKHKQSLNSHDFGNWNNNQVFINFNDSLKSGAVRQNEHLEFIVHISVNIPVLSDSILIESEAITKIYRTSQPNNLRIVFDLDKLRKASGFVVKFADKMYTVTLSPNHLYNKYSNQRIYYLEENGLRNLMD